MARTRYSHKPYNPATAGPKPDPNPTTPRSSVIHHARRFLALVVCSILPSLCPCLPARRGSSSSRLFYRVSRSRRPYLRLLVATHPAAGRTIPVNHRRARDSTDGEERLIKEPSQTTPDGNIHQTSQVLNSARYTTERARQCRTGISNDIRFGARRIFISLRRPRKLALALLLAASNSASGILSSYCLHWNKSIGLLVSTLLPEAIREQSDVIGTIRVPHPATTTCSLSTEQSELS